MNTYPSLKAIVIAGAGALASCASGPQTTKLPVSGNYSSDTSLSGQVLREVNSYRRNAGAQELIRHPGLDRLAQEHCEYLRKNRGKFNLHGKYVSHFGSEARAQIARERYQMRSVSENVAATSSSGGQNAASTLVKLWANSKDHAYTMRSAWTHTGVGSVVDEDGTVFSTQLFATVTHSQLTTRERFNRF